MGVGIELYRDGDVTPYFGVGVAAGLILGGVDLSVGDNDGSLVDADLENGVPFWFLSGNGAQDQPSVSVAGDTLTWTANPDGAFYTGRLVYGIR